MVKNIPLISNSHMLRFWTSSRGVPNYVFPSRVLFQMMWFSGKGKYLLKTSHKEEMKDILNILIIFYTIHLFVFLMLLINKILQGGKWDQSTILNPQKPHQFANIKRIDFQYKVDKAKIFIINKMLSFFFFFFFTHFIIFKI